MSLRTYQVIALDAAGALVLNEQTRWDPTGHESYMPGFEAYLALDAPGMAERVYRVIEPGYIETVRLSAEMLLVVHEDFQRKYADAPPTPGPIGERINQLMMLRYGYPVRGPMALILMWPEGATESTMPADDQGTTETTSGDDDGDL